MKLLGILGGMSWTSTAEYYRLLNEEVAAQQGGLHSARLLLHSVDFEEVAILQRTGEWDAAGALLADAARGLERVGAQGLIIATNTMHRVADTIQTAVDIPLLHIADATGERIRAAGLTRVGLLATAFTMEQAFYTGRLEENYGLGVMVPEADERAETHRIIFDELCKNDVRPASRATYRRIMAGLVQRGAQAIILGCTEIMLLVGQDDVTVPVFDTTRIHVEAAVQWMLEEESTPPA
ncbi:aspartate/glutamate racemase family protein [Deinococcus sp. KSM4-11]|uniref:aspartate/glutamate racemase family protein n=1 Tax=Deinococcus sp. KSM4-11 TaxID=2568654 RepID=UPI0010A41676|nr:aspartate/glutamate racemase family protein [Deinococcus sp. KSM4-11]THF87906.1 aspartate/glutamate racemase family protein [Deinococcus sp. KSM4-11]